MVVPVLVTAYNRPDLMSNLFVALADQGVKNVWLHVDGPLPRDLEAHQKIRALASQPWPFRLTVNFSFNHLGCRGGMETALTWFFEEFDEGIILEDDCLPLPGFFAFCRHYLEVYRHRPDVAMVSGHLPLGHWPNGGDHALTATGQIWGWATWRRAWLAHLNRQSSIRQIDRAVFINRLGNTHMADELFRLTQKSWEGQLDTWDYLWMYSLYASHNLCVMPTTNLVINQGFDHRATHTPAEPEWHKLLSSQHWPLRQVSGTGLEHGRDRGLEHAVYNMVRGFIGAQHGLAQPRAEAPTARLRIAQVAFADRGGGAEKVMMALHRSYLAQGHDSRVFVAHKKSDHSQVYPLEWGGYGGLLGKKEFSVSASFKKQNWWPDVVHVHNVHGMPIDLNDLGRTAIRTPVVWTLHDQWLVSRTDKHPFIVDCTDKSILQKSDKGRYALLSQVTLAAPSIWLAEQVSRHYGKPVQWVPNGVDTTVFSPKAHTVRSGLLFVANHAQKNPYKDYQTLVNAWICLNQKLSKPIDLTVVGGTPELRSHGAGKLTVLPFEIDEQAMARHYQQCAVYVHASVNDNFPLSILEALACGAKVVAAQVGGIPEIEAAPHQITFYEPASVISLTRALAEALNSINEFSGHSCYSDLRMARQYLDLYGQLLANA